MHRIIKIQLRKKQLFYCVCLCLILFGASGCKKESSRELYHRFPDQTWARFNFHSFEIPVKDSEKAYDIYLFARFTSDFQYDVLNFNMTMNTSSGEERIQEYGMKVKSKEGKFLIECKQDSCCSIIILKRELYLSKAGILKIEIENLTPRLVTEGVMGIGIRMEESNKRF